ncbi:Replication factor C small subunit [uncultured archaeon]|nr:Replication factor C small subunit [uncultured archaeon]
MNEEFEPWIEKYRPKKLKEVIGHKNIVEKLEYYVKERNLPHLLFVGPPGVGKTTCVLALVRELFGDEAKQSFLELNASDERGIDIVRGKIKDFARTMGLSSLPFKIIFLDEADALTDDAQQALRRTMEKFSSNTRFILGANYSSKIIEPIQSRCAVFRFTGLNDEDIIKVVKHIAKQENIEITEDGLKAIVYIANGDARKATNCIQGASTDTKKIDEKDIYTVASRARPHEIETMILKALEGDFLTARKNLDELMIRYGMSAQDVASQMFRQVITLDKISDKEKLKIIDYIGETDYRITEGSNERIQLEALLAKITSIKTS